MPLSSKEDSHNNKTGDCRHCSVCGRLPFVGRDVVESAVFDNPVWDFDAGLYNVIEKIHTDQTREPPWMDPVRAKAIAEKVQRHSKRLQTALVQTGLLHRENQNFSLSDPTEVKMMAPFKYDELKIGKLLGTGGFSSTFEITGFKLDDATHRAANTYETTARDFLAEHAQRPIEEVEVGRKKGSSATSISRYAVKHLRRSLVRDPGKLERAAIDLALEAQLLLVMDHPNIVSIRGWALKGAAGYQNGRHTGFFLILDRLPLTLEDCSGSWRVALHKYQARAKLPWSKQKYGVKLQELLVKRMSVLYDTACAIEYMHDRRVINRDIKAGNIGFDVRGDLKIFDFGLSRVLPSEPDEHDNFKMSRVGTKYYIAPEVKDKKPYNLSADMYSFGVLIWETLALATPREVLRVRPSSSVCVSKLPVCECCWPDEVIDMHKRCMSLDPRERPACSSLKEELRVAITMYGGEDMAQRKMKPRRSTLRLDLSQIDLTVDETLSSNLSLPNSDQSTSMASYSIHS